MVCFCRQAKAQAQSQAQQLTPDPPCTPENRLKRLAPAPPGFTATNQPLAHGNGQVGANRNSVSGGVGRGAVLPAAPFGDAAAAAAASAGGIMKMMEALAPAGQATTEPGSRMLRDSAGSGGYDSPSKRRRLEGAAGAAADGV